MVQKRKKTMETKRVCVCREGERDGEESGLKGSCYPRPQAAFSPGAWGGGANAWPRPHSETRFFDERPLVAGGVN